MSETPREKLLELLMKSEEIELEALPGKLITVREGLTKSAAELKRTAILELLEGFQVQNGRIVKG